MAVKVTPNLFKRKILEHKLKTIETEVRAGSFDYAANERKLAELRLMAEAMGAVDLVGQGLLVLGIMQSLALRFDDAHASLKRALDQFHALGDAASALKTMNRIATTHNIAGELEQAALAYEDALKAVDLANLTPAMFGDALSLLSNYGIALHSLGRIDDAEAAMNSALALFSRSNPVLGTDAQYNGISIGNAHLVLASIHISRAQYDEAWGKALLTCEVFSHLKSPIRTFIAYELLMTVALHHPAPPRAPETVWQEITAFDARHSEDPSSAGLFAHYYLHQAIEWVRMYGTLPWAVPWARRLAQRAEGLYAALNNVEGTEEARAFLRSLDISAA